MTSSLTIFHPLPPSEGSRSALNGFISTLGMTKAREGLINQIDQDLGRQMRGRALESIAPKSPLRQVFEDFVTELSKVSMHYPAKMRRLLTAQFRSLLSDDEWNDGDILPSKESIRTVLRALNVLEVEKTPSVGTNGAGSITLSWFNSNNRLALDCFANDRVLFVLTRLNDLNEKERAAGETRVRKLPEVLAPYDPDVWFT